MAPPQWSNLPPDLLLTISKILNSDVDLLRLRSVCSSWRSSLPPRQTPISFPLKVPPLLSHPNSIPHSASYFQFRYPTLPRGGQFSLNYSTLYRLSPPELGPCAGDPSDGCLLRVSEVNPNFFSLLTPLLHGKIKFPPGTMPKHLNLLDYRISELCRCYNLSFVSKKGLVKPLTGLIRNVIVLPNYMAGCDLVVLVLVSYSDMRYWKFGDSDWTSTDIKDYFIDDVISFDGVCYAIGSKGELVSFDSNFNLSVVFPSWDDLASNYNNFVVYKSDLYVVSKIYNREPDEYSSEFEGPYSSPGSPPGWYSSDDDFDEVTLKRRRLSHNHSDEEDDEDEYEYEFSDEDVGDGNAGFDEEATGAEIPLRLKIAKVCGYGPCRGYKYLGDNEIFLSSDDVSVCVSSEDFRDCKGNCVYVAHRRFFDDDRGIESGDHHAVYDFDKCRTRSLLLENAPDRAKIFWPPDWLNDKTMSSN